MVTKIIQIDYEKSQGLSRELEAFEKIDIPISEFPTPESFFKNYISSTNGLEIIRHLSDLNPGEKILDIGVGSGETSIYLAYLGCDVSVVEPSPKLCQNLAKLAENYEFSLKIYCTNGESISKIKEQFDGIIFNSSLHHCDDPILALKNCFDCLKFEGKLIIANEPFLPFYRSKKWFYSRLETHPKEMGHYGGNEHNYRYHEYISMLRKAGFNKIISIPNIIIDNYKLRFTEAKNKNINGQPLYQDRTLKIKKAYYYLISKIFSLSWSFKPFLSIMKYFSIIPSTFLVTKTSS